ncbi:MAG: hypothetical protein J7502_19510, partial [Flavisolibacter sp.]|nr:hypothetical protein [Flavisolibacter sp.]
RKSKADNMNEYFLYRSALLHIELLLRRTLQRFVILIIIFEVHYYYQLFFCWMFQYAAPTEL